jgi:isoleucyl-tRNA synthetase
MRKDCLYTYAPDSPQRRSAQSALYRILRTITRLMAPILCHTAEEAWRFMTGGESDDSVLLQEWPTPEADIRDPGLEDVYERILEVREQVTKALEEKRSAKELGTSLEAAVKITAPRPVADILLERDDILPTLLIVSAVGVEAKSDDGEVEVEVEKAGGGKCSRCWNYRASVGEDASHPELCDRCLPVVMRYDDRRGRESGSS